jgi:two-component system, LytTR family, response regulator
MTCLIIDDEPLARQGLSLYTDKISSLQLMGSFSGAALANEFLQKTMVDLLFLDINMPGLNGLDFAKSLLNAPLLVFTTAYPQYALESYELEAVDYLVKPIRFERFLKAVNKAENLWQLLQQQEKKSEVESISNDFMFIKADRKYVKIKFENIFFIEGMKDYVVIHTNTDKFITAMNIKTIGNQLPENVFFRTSKSYIININHLSSFDTDFVFINNQEIPIGANFKEEFFKKYVDGKLVKR